MKRETNNMIKHMIRKCIWRSGNSQADKWLIYCLGYTSTGIRLQNMTADECYRQTNSQIKLQRKGKQAKPGFI